MVNIMIRDREKIIGGQIKSARLRKGMTQAEVAARIYVTTPTISRLESGKGSSLATFIKVVKVLGEDKWFDSFAPVVTVSPIAMKNTGKRKERVRKKSAK
jgi:transcriptional regulator with XRE-family HTH domain